jgi:phospholipid N-methyltransferase
MARELTQAAQAAKHIRQYLGAKGIKAKVKSSNFSMGSAVDITVYDQPPDVVKQIEQDTDKYEYGTFDGMTDSSGVKNRDFDGPQAKYVHVENNRSDELCQAVWSFLRGYCSEAEELPEKLKDVSGVARVWNEYVPSLVYQVISGYRKELAEKFWPTWKTDSATTGDRALQGVKIEEHTHTKKGFQMFIVIRPNRVSREEYLELLDRARSLRGWYSRKWGATPAGFAFKNAEAAKAFAEGAAAPADNNKAEAPKPKPKKDHSKKLRKLADGLANQIENKLADRLTNTPKRLAQANHARLDGERLQRTQSALYALAALHEAGEVPDVLKDITTKAAVYELVGTKKEPVPNGYHSYSVCTGEPQQTTPAAVTLWALIEGKTDAEKKQDSIRRKVEGLQFSNIPGYFPTPAHIADKMVELAQLEEHLAVCEPEAGSGAIMDAIDRAGFNSGRRVALETNYSLYELLQEKYDSWTIYRGDFLAQTETGTLSPGFDRIIMNPPYEKGQDIAHIKHAVSLLRPGGRVVALCAGGPRQHKELAPLATHWEELPAGSFKEAGTRVNVSLLVIDN